MPDDLLDDELWEKLLQYMARRCPITASITRYPPVVTSKDYYRKDGLPPAFDWHYACGTVVVWCILATSATT